MLGIGSGISLIITLNVFNFVSNTNPTVASGQTTYDIRISPGASDPRTPMPYNPRLLPADFNQYVPVGSTVTWHNDDQTFHTVTSGEPSTGPDFNFDSGILPPGQSYQVPFPNAGYFKYYCTVHPFMNGVVRVR